MNGPGLVTIPFSLFQNSLQIPIRIPEKVVVARFSGILVISGIVVVAGRLLTNYQVSQAFFLCPPGLFISFRDARQQEMQATTALEGHQVSAVPLGFKRTELKWKNFLLFRREKAGKVSFNIAK